MKERRLNQTLDFGGAMTAAKAGLMIRRPEWPVGDFVFRQVPAQIAPEIIPRMVSLPPAVKQELERRGWALHYRDQFARVNGYSQITGWSPTSADALADDWQSLD